MSARSISAIKDPAVSGYAHAYVVIRPWIAYVNGKRLVDKRGHVRRFSTQEAAIAAASRSAR